MNWPKWFKKQKPRYPVSDGKISIGVALTGYEDFMKELSQMTDAVEQFDQRCAQLGERLEGITLTITNNYNAESAWVDSENVKDALEVLAKK